MADFPRTATDSVAIGADAIGRSWGTIRTATDSVPIGLDSIAARRTLTDSVPIGTDTVLVASTRVRTATDTILSTHFVRRTGGYQRAPSDTVAIGADAIVHALGLNLSRTATDTVAIGADTVTPFLSARTLSDTVVTSDDLVSRRGLKRVAHDPSAIYRLVNTDTFSGDLSAYTGISGLSIVGGELVGTLGAGSYMQRTVGYIADVPVEIAFDFWIPGDADPLAYYGYEVDGDGRYIYIDNDDTGVGIGQWSAYLHDGNRRVPFDVVRSSWYRVKVVLGSLAIGGVWAFKVWKRVDPEPSGWQAVGQFASASDLYGNNWVYIAAQNGAVEPGKIDNLVISGGGGVSDAAMLPTVFRSQRTFAIGGPGMVTTSRIFNIEAPLPRSLSIRRFDIEGHARSTTERRFDIEGALRSTSRRTFDILSAAITITPDADVGTWINPYTIASTTLTAPASQGATTVTVASTAGIAAGMLLQIGDEFLAVASVTSATVLVLAAPLSVALLSGALAATARGFIPGIHVFSKAGVPIGVLNNYTLSTAPTMMIGTMGSAGFSVSRAHPQAHLIQPDRLIAFAFRIGSNEMWAGNIEVDDNASSIITVMAPDAFSLLTGAPIRLKDELATTPAAGGVYRRVISEMNLQKLADSELTWEVDDAGLTNLYYGALDYDGDPLDAIGDIALRSDTECRWQAVVLPSGYLQLTLVVRNEITVAGGAAIADGIGGNIASNPRWIRDSAPIRNGLKLSGIASRISDYLPDWARWAAENVTPEATVYVDPGTNRRRVDRTVSVGFGLSPALMKSIADQIVAALWFMYRTFLYAYHDQYGRPYHPGWGYEGPPSTIEPFLHTGFDWRTRRRLVQFAGEPASVVMYSAAELQVVATTYNRITRAYKARRYWASEQEGVMYVPKMQIHGRARRWASSGGVLTEYGSDSLHGVINFDHSSALVSANPVTMPHYYDDADGAAQTDWHTVRRVTQLSEDGTLLEGVWYEMALPLGPTTNPTYYKRPTVGDAPYLRIVMVPTPANIEFSSAFITKMYEAERGRIRDWDPRRDGVGVFMSKTSVYNNAVSTTPRWFLTPFGVGVDGATTLTTGIGPTESVIYVDSVFSLPRLGTDWDGLAQIGSDPVNEFVVVTSIAGNALTVQRAQNGTPGIIHELGTSVKAMNVKETSVFEHLWANLDWTEGREWATRLLTKLNKPFIRVSADLTNRDGTWATVRLGSLHSITLSTEGAAPLTGTVRCIGMSPDALTGRMEVILEWRT